MTEFEKRLQQHSQSVKAHITSPVHIERKDMFVMKKRRISFVLVAALIALLTATTALAATFNWHESLIAFFNPTPEQVEKLEGAIDIPSASVSQNGVTIEIKQTIADSQGVYILYELTVPEDVILTDDVMFEFWHLSLAMEQHAGRLMQSVILEQEDNRRLGLIHSTGAGIVENQMMRLEMRDLGALTSLTQENPRYDAFSRFETLVEGEWILEWELAFTDTTTLNIEVNEGVELNGEINHVLTNVVVSLMSVTVHIEGEDVFTAFTPIIRFVNGDEIKMDYMAENTLYSWASILYENCRDNPTNFGLYTIHTTFDRLVNLDEIESIIVNNVVVPVR